MRRSRVMLGVGDIIAIPVDSGAFAFARVIAEIALGHVIEVFDRFSAEVGDAEEIVAGADRLCYPQIIDSYSILELGRSSWRLLREGDRSHRAPDLDELRFRMGPREIPRLIDLAGKETSVESHDGLPYPWYSPNSDTSIERLVRFWRDKRATS